MYQIFHFLVFDGHADTVALAHVQAMEGQHQLLFWELLGCLPLLVGKQHQDSQVWAWNTPSVCAASGGGLTEQQVA